MISRVFFGSVLLLVGLCSMSAFAADQSEFDQLRKRLNRVEQIGKQTASPGSAQANTPVANSPEALVSRYYQATSLLKSDRVLEAVPMLEQVTQGFIELQGKNHPNSLRSATSLANAYNLVGRNLESEKILRDILPRLERVLGKGHPDTLIASDNLVEALSGKRDYASALKVAQELYAQRTRALGPEHVDTLATLLNIGKGHLALGDYEESRKILTQAMEIAARKEYHDVAERARRFLAVAYYALGDPDTGRAMRMEAIDTLEASPLKTVAALHAAGHQRAEKLILAGKLEEARRVLTSLVEEESRLVGKYHNLTVLTLLSIYEVLFLEKNISAAENTLIDFISRYALITEMDSEFMSPQFVSLGVISDMQKKNEAAVSAFKFSLITLDLLREKDTGLARDLQQVHHTKHLELSYQLAIMSLLVKNRTTEALAVLNLMKEAELDDVSRAKMDELGVKSDFLSDSESYLYENCRTKMANLYALGQKLQVLHLDSESLSAEEKRHLAILETQIEERVEDFRSFLHSMQSYLEKNKKDNELEKVALSNRKMLHSIPQRMGHGSVLIHTVVTDGSVLIFLTTPSMVYFRNSPVSREIFDTTISEFHAALTNPSVDPRPAGKKLYDAIIAPIEKDLDAAGAKTLMFSLDGVLRYVPMAALYDGKQWLAEKYDVVMFTEAARESMQQSPSGDGTVAAMGVTKALGGFSALPSVAEEISGIVKTKDSAGVLPGSTYLDKQFTRNTLAASLQKGVPLIHVASHFQFDPADQKASFLLLGDGKKLTMGEMFGQKGLSFDKVDLLTLSACDTASGVKKGDGREVESFGAMAQRHGAKAVLASLWPVADASTAAFMQEFYALRGLDGKNKAACLGETQRAMAQGRLSPVNAGVQRSQRGKVSVAAPDAGMQPSTALSGWSHPYFWAPFILMGNWE